MKLPVQDICADDFCSLDISAYAYGASQDRPVKVTIKTEQSNIVYSEEFFFTDSETRKVTFGLAKSIDPVIVSFFIPDAISPHELKKGSDKRRLGIALKSINIAPSE